MESFDELVIGSIIKNNYEYIIDFEKGKRGYRILQSSTTGSVTFHFTSLLKGNYKIIVPHASTVAGITTTGTLQVGYARIGVNGHNLTGYLDVSLNLENINATQIYVTSSPEFTVQNDKEIIIATWSKTTDDGSGYLYLMPLILRKV